ncbi:LPS assembly lipoprotein LptE [Roseovarius sp. ZX-A-9]|uniref:LPS assembly lipoprotein LptE n=1 Tax=Roseovarius sp. ZX-A-9 TaxID=3014783 RepID=UPI002330E52D|nr:LPS assembly lipoprotein LptE [Roseovarius sp. ZX-A-9]
MTDTRHSRRFFCLASLAALGGCGFTPVYGPGGSAAALHDAVLVDAPTTRDAFLLVREIEQRLGRGNPAVYGLSYAIKVDEESIAIDLNDVTQRYNLLGEITYALRNLETGAVVTSGKVSNFTGYSASGSTVATQAAERDARARLMSILANMLITRLVAAPVSAT